MGGSLCGLVHRTQRERSRLEMQHLVTSLGCTFGFSGARLLLLRQWAPDLAPCLPPSLPRPGGGLAGGKGRSPGRLGARGDPGTSRKHRSRAPRGARGNTEDRSGAPEPKSFNRPRRGSRPRNKQAPPCARPGAEAPGKPPRHPSQRRERPGLRGAVESKRGTHERRSSLLKFAFLTSLL